MSSSKNAAPEIFVNSGEYPSYLALPESGFSYSSDIPSSKSSQQEGVEVLLDEVSDPEMTIGVETSERHELNSTPALDSEQNNLDSDMATVTLSSTLLSGDFQNLTAGTGPGFGNSGNDYSWSMIEHNDYLFVGTMNLTTGGELWRTSLNQTSWTKLLDFEPQVDGFRELVVYQGQLYAFTTGDAATEPSGYVSSDNGNSWTEITGGPLDSQINESIRTSIEHNGLLYLGTFDPSGAEIWTFDGTNWSLVKKFTNGIEKVSEFIKFENDLYVGVWNGNGNDLLYTGENFDIDVTPSTGRRFVDRNNGGTMDTIEFQNQLYLSTWNFVNGFSLFRTADPLTGQWEVITRNGFGNRQNYYGWVMEVYDDLTTPEEGDELYLGVANPNDLAQLYSTSDGSNWQPTLLPDLGPLTWGIRSLLVTSNDQLILGTGTKFFVSEEEANPGELGTQVWAADL